MAAALWLLWAALPGAAVIDENVEIPARDWRYESRPVASEPAVIDGFFEAARADAQVRLVLLSEADLKAWNAGRKHDEIASTLAGPHGRLRVTLHETDVYVAIENLGPQATAVRLRVALEQPRVGHLGPGRRLAVILISAGVFLAIVTFSARKIVSAWRR